MKIIYSLPHPADQLDSGQAGHTVRARALLGALEAEGHAIVRLQAAVSQESQAAVNTYRQLVKKLLPRPIALRLRDMARVAYSRRYAARLVKAIQLHQPDLIFETHIAFSLAGKIASEQTGLPLALDDVAPSWEEEQQYGVGAKKLARSTHREVTQRASLLVAVSGVIRQMLIDEDIEPDKIVTIPNGISDVMLAHGTDGSVRRASLGITPEAVVIVFVGSFQPYHRVDLLLKAFAQLAGQLDVHLLLVGDGQRGPAARTLASELRITDRVTFTGRVPYDEVASNIAAGDIAVMPATNSYGNPMKLYDYMALGKPIVAPDQPTITEIVTHEDTALLFPAEDIGALAEQLTRLTRDGALRKRLGMRGGLEAQQHTWHKRGEALSDVLQRVVTGSRT